MNIKSISALYHETHAVSHARTRLKGDSQVNHALDCRISRESEWTRKQSTTVKAQETLDLVEDLNTVCGVRPGFAEVPATITKYHNTVKEAVKERVIFENDKELHNHVKTLVKQGHFLDLLQTSHMDATWQSFMYDLPKGTMKFLLNSCIDTLPTLANLQQWGKSPTSRCPMPGCGNKQTTNHILSCCKVYLESGRFLWRHNAVVSYIMKMINIKSFTAYGDIPGHTTAAGGTIPANLCPTLEKPDLVIIDEKKKTVDLFELTVPGELRISVSNKLKADRYDHFKKDINNEYKTTITPFEISCTGHVTRENRDRLRKIHKFTDKSKTLKQFIQDISYITILSSYYIFIARNKPAWSDPP